MRKLVHLLITLLLLGLLPLLLSAQQTNPTGQTQPNANAGSDNLTIDYPNYWIHGLKKAADGKFYASRDIPLFIWAQYKKLENFVPNNSNSQNAEPEIRISSIFVKVDNLEWIEYRGELLVQDFKMYKIDNQTYAKEEPQNNSNTKTVNGAATATFSIRDEGVHTIYTYAVDEFGNKGQEVRAEVIIDNTAPEVAFRVENKPIFPQSDYNLALTNEDGYFVGPYNRIFVEAFDLRSGAENIQYYSPSDNKWVDIDFKYKDGDKAGQIKTREELVAGHGNNNEHNLILVNADSGSYPDSIANKPQPNTGFIAGWNLIRAKAVDLVGNRSTEFTIKVYLDVTPPEITARPLFGHIQSELNNQPGGNPNANQPQPTPYHVMGTNNAIHMIPTDNGSGVRLSHVLIQGPFESAQTELTLDQLKALPFPASVGAATAPTNTSGTTSTPTGPSTATTGGTGGTASTTSNTALPVSRWNSYTQPLRFYMTGIYYIYGHAVDNVGNPTYKTLIQVYVNVDPPVPQVHGDPNAQDV